MGDGRSGRCERGSEKWQVRVRQQDGGRCEQESKTVAGASKKARQLAGVGERRQLPCKARHLSTCQLRGRNRASGWGSDVATPTRCSHRQPPQPPRRPPKRPPLRLGNERVRRTSLSPTALRTPARFEVCGQVYNTPVSFVDHGNAGPSFLTKLHQTQPTVIEARFV